MGRRLAGCLNYQDHAGAQDGHVAIVALEGADRGVVEVGDGIERFASLYLVVDDGGSFGPASFISGHLQPLNLG